MGVRGTVIDTGTTSSRCLIGAPSAPSSKSPSVSNGGVPFWNWGRVIVARTWHTSGRAPVGSASRAKPVIEGVYCARTFSESAALSLTTSPVVKTVAVVTSVRATPFASSTGHSGA